MFIKGKLEGTDKVRVWDENIYTNIYQVDNEKDILNRTGDSIEETVITYIRKKLDKEYIYFYVESNQVPVPTRWWKSTLLPCKINKN